MILLGISYFFMEGKDDVRNHEEITQRRIVENPVRVSTEIARIGKLEQSIVNRGIVHAPEDVQIRSEVSGKVIRIFVSESDKMSKGQLIIEIENEEYLIRHERALADRNLKLSQFAVELSHDRRDLPPEKYYKNISKALDKGEKLNQFFLDKRHETRAIQLGLYQANSELMNIGLLIDKCNIRAPIEGIIYNIQVVEGQSVNMGDELFSIVNLDNLYVKASVMESDLRYITTGNNAKLNFFSHPEREYEGKIEFIRPIIDKRTLSADIFISFDNPEYLILPNMNCNVKMITHYIDDALLVPRSAVLIRDHDPLVFVARQNRAFWHYVELGKRNDSYYQILDGIEEGDRVIIQGHSTLAHQALITE